MTTPNSGKKGFPLLPVLIAIALIGAAVFYLSRGDGTGAQSGSLSTEQSTSMQAAPENVPNDNADPAAETRAADAPATP